MGIFGSICSPRTILVHVISRLAHQASKDTKTAGVFVRNKRWYLLYNEEFSIFFTKEKCFGLFKHECYHLILIIVPIVHIQIKSYGISPPI